MSEQYHQATAIHYAAYRPPLHGIILERILSNQEVFKQGLDIGCGTGYSAIALAKYCSQVYGIDPSLAMLTSATPHPKITYRQGSGENLPIPNDFIDVVTFAGSLFYTKSQLLIAELKRVCCDKATIIVYDFEVLLDYVLVDCDINPQKAVSNYNHEINFSDRLDFKEIAIGKEQINLEVTATELAHVLLSSSYRYDAFVQQYADADPFMKLVNELENAKDQHLLKVNIYFARYQNSNREYC